MDPQFSIIMPAFNAERTIAAAIRSVQQQTLDRWELIIVDDGSCDATGEVARSCATADDRVMVVAQPNQGAGVARNRAAGMARGDWLVFLDADDRLFEHYLETIAAVMDSRPDFAVYAPNAVSRYPNGDDIVVYPRPSREVRLEDLIRGPEMPVYSTVSRSVFDGVGGFRDTYAEDYDLWLRILQTGAKALRIGEVLVAYDASGTHNKSRQLELQLASELDAIAAVCERAADAELVRLCEERRAELTALLALVPVKERIRKGEMEGARAAFWRNRRALRPPRRYAILTLVMISPRLYRAVVRKVDPSSI